MANWWKASEEDIAASQELQQERAASYFNTFYGSDERRLVLLDIGKMCYTRRGSAEASIALIELFHQLKARAGLTQEGEKAAVDAEAASI